MKRFVSMIGVTALAALMIPQASMAFCNDYVAPDYEMAARDLYDRGVLKGNPDGTCTLNNQINRISFAVMAMRSTIGEDSAQSQSYQSGLFNDLNDSNVWYAKYAATANYYGILKGDGNGNLRAADPVNAAEAMVISTRSYGFQMPAPVSGQEWYTPTHEILHDAGVTTYAANHIMTRGEVAKMLFEIDTRYHDIDATISSYTPGASTPTPTPQPSGGTIPATSSTEIPQVQLNFRVLVEYFEHLNFQEVAYIFRTLDETQQLQLGIYSPFGSLAHLYACQADSTIIFNDGTGVPKDCNYAVQDWAYTPQPYFTADSYANQKRNDLLISIKCATGEIDAGSCGAYAGAVQNYNNAMNETSLRIITNLGGNSCIVGDPDCVAY